MVEAQWAQGVELCTGIHFGAPAVAGQPTSEGKVAVGVLGKSMDTTNPTAEKMEFSTITLTTTEAGIKNMVFGAPGSGPNKVVHKILDEKATKALLEEVAKETEAEGDE